MIRASTGSRLELNRALYHRAAMLLHHGDAGRKDAARADAQAARAAFAAMGAIPDRDRAARLLAG